MRSEHSLTGIRGLAARPAARAGAVLVVLWLGTAILLRGTSDFGGMAVTLTCASVVLWGDGAGPRFVVGQLVLWTALLLGTALLLSESPQLLAVLALFGAAAAWFVVAEPMLRAPRPPL